MKVYISCDIEGIGCVVRPEHSTIQGREYARACQFMTEEANAAIRGAFDSGASRVLISDSHNVGINLLPEELDQRAELIMGSPRPLSMMEGIQQGFDAVLFVGYHARPGTQDGLIVHNFHSRIRNITLNGIALGELGMNAALAGLYNAPVVMVTGDAVTCDEAMTLMPWVETVAVKQGIGAYAAQCLLPHLCRQKIYDATIAALMKINEKKLFCIDDPVVMEVEVTTASTADRLERIPGLERIAPTTMRTQPSDLRTAYDTFLTVADLVDMVPFI